MSYLTKKFLQKEKIEHWRHLFDVVICDSKKPQFYERWAPFRSLNVEDNTINWDRVTSFNQSGVYIGGSYAQFLQLVDVKGPQICYFGG